MALELLLDWLAQGTAEQAPSMDLLNLIDLLSKGSGIVLAFFIIGFVFELVVSGKSHQRALASKEAEIVRLITEQARVQQAKDAEIARLQTKLDELGDKLVEAVRVTGQAVRRNTSTK